MGVSFKVDSEAGFEAVCNKLKDYGTKGAERLRIMKEGPQYEERYYLDVVSSAGIWERFIRFVTFGWKSESLRLKKVSEFAVAYFENNFKESERFQEICIRNKSALENIKYTLKRGGQDVPFQLFLDKVFNHAREKQELENAKRSFVQEKKKYEVLNRHIMFSVPLISQPADPSETDRIDLLVKATSSDVTITCSDGEEVSTLLGLLKQGAFFDNFDTRQKTVTLPFTKRTVLKALEVMKNAPIGELVKIEDAIELCKLAEYIKHDRLISISSKMLITWLARAGVDTFYTNYKTMFADLPIPSKFHSSVIDHLAANLNTFINHIEFKNLPANIIYPLFFSDNLFVQNEDVVYNAILTWAKHNKGSDTLATALSKEIEGKSLFNLIRDKDLSEEHKKGFATLLEGASYIDKTDKTNLSTRGLQANFDPESRELSIKFPKLGALLLNESAGPAEKTLHFKVDRGLPHNLFSASLRFTDGKFTIHDEACDASLLYLDEGKDWKSFAGCTISCALSEDFETTIKLATAPGGMSLTGGMRSLDPSHLLGMIDGISTTSEEIQLASDGSGYAESRSQSSEDGYNKVGGRRILPPKGRTVSAVAGAASRTSRRVGT